LPPVAPQAQGVSRQMDRLAALSEPAWLHAEVARRLGEKLQAILLQPDHWLDWGGCLGGGQAVVVERYPQAQRFVFEPTPVLARRSEQQWQATLRTDLVEPTRSAAGAFKALLGRLTAPQPTASPPPSPVFHAFNHKPQAWPEDGVGLVWANMALHAETDVPALLRAWHRALKTDGFVMCSGLGPDTARELKAVYQHMGWGLPTIDFIDMHDLGDAFVKAGFADPVMDMERITLTWPDAPSMLAECRQWGGNVAVGRFAGCRTPRWHARLLEALQRGLMRPDGRLGLTLELVYGHAIKPLPRVPVSVETRVSLGDMKRIIGQGKPQGQSGA
jgi:malonyl-CoA O-methyltransferase